jgi:NADH-quinone oxidoreductase subunit L
MLFSISAVVVGIGLGWWLYNPKRPVRSNGSDILESRWPEIFALLRNKWFVDEAYEATFVRFNAWAARACDSFDRIVLGGMVKLCGWAIVCLGWIDQRFDDFVVNLGFDKGWQSLIRGGGILSRRQTGRIQDYLRVLALALVILVLLLVWGWRGS